MAKVVEMKVRNSQFFALPSESGAHGSAAVRKYSPDGRLRQSALLVDDCAGVVAARIKEGDALIVAIFPSWILAVANEHHPASRIEIRPFDPADLILTHGRRDGEPYDPANGDLLSGIRFERRDEAVKFVLRRPAVSLFAPTDEPKPRKGDPCQHDWLHRQDDPMNRRRVREDCLDVSEVYSQRHGAGAFAGALLAELDQSLSTKFCKAKPAEPSLKKNQAGGLRPTDAFANFLKVVPMEADKVAKAFCVAAGPSDRRLPTINAAFNFKRPHLGVFATQKRFVYILPLSANLNAPGTGTEFGEGKPKRVRSVCSEASYCGEKGRFMAVKRVHTSQPDKLRLQEK